MADAYITLHPNFSSLHITILNLYKIYQDISIYFTFHKYRYIPHVSGSSVISGSNFSRGWASGDEGQCWSCSEIGGVFARRTQRNLRWRPEIHWIIRLNKEKGYAHPHWKLYNGAESYKDDYLICMNNGDQGPPGNLYRSPHSLGKIRLYSYNMFQLLSRDELEMSQSNDVSLDWSTGKLKPDFPYIQC